MRRSNLVSSNENPVRRYFKIVFEYVLRMDDVFGLIWPLRQLQAELAD